jgi:transcriptional regulator with XRE-family HTH domain
LGRVESGSMNLTLTSIAILCKYFEITFEEFFRDMESQLPENAGL